MSVAIDRIVPPNFSAGRGCCVSLRPLLLTKAALSGDPMTEAVLSPHPCPPVPDSLLWRKDEPIRGELCSAEHLGQLARELARASTVAEVPRRRSLLNQLDENRHFLIRAHRVIAEAA